MGGVYIMPVLQGYAPADYASHVRQYGPRLAFGAYVGVGSVCKRNARPAEILAVLRAIHAERPDLRLHGFGVKKTSLRVQAIRDALYSADSMAWSYLRTKAGSAPERLDGGQGIREGRRLFGRELRRPALARARGMTG